MITYFTVTYKLFDKGLDGNLKPFDRTKGIYTAEVTADTKEAAVEQVKRDFNMLTVEIVAVSEPKTMTQEEYKKGE